MSAHEIDQGTAVIIQDYYEPGDPPWLRILTSAPGPVLITGIVAIRNLRAACDAALGEGEEK